MQSETLEARDARQRQHCSERIIRIFTSKIDWASAIGQTRVTAAIRTLAAVLEPSAHALQLCISSAAHNTRAHAGERRIQRTRAQTQAAPTSTCPPCPQAPHACTSPITGRRHTAHVKPVERQLEHLTAAPSIGFLQPPHSRYMLVDI